MMDEELFWEIVDNSRENAKTVILQPTEDFMRAHQQTLAVALRELSPEQIVAFYERFCAYHNLAYRWDLWGAAYWLFGGCGDDGFTDFRACLISLGKTLFFKVLDDPDSLAEIVNQKHVPFMQAEGFQYVPMKVYREKTGEDTPWSRGTINVGRRSAKPAGRKFDFEDEEVMQRRFPRIVAQFECGDAG